MQAKFMLTADKLEGNQLAMDWMAGVHPLVE
jgi:hypothetical protein